jgi:drug/metabolite transporter (DMT)-like permease
MVRKHLGYLALAGFFGVTMSTTLVYIAAHSSKALNMALIAMCGPIFLAVFARLFLKDTFTLRRIVGLITATLGAVLLIADGQLSRLMSLTFSEGDVWMLIQAAGFAVYSILIKVKPAELSQSVCLSSLFILGWLFLVPWFVLEIIWVKSISFSPTAIGAIIYLGVGTSVLGFFCWNRAIMIIGPVRTGFVLYCLPLFSGVEAFLVLNESVHWVHVVSGVLILAGLIVATRK